MNLSSYEDLRKYMDELGMFSMDLGLGRMEAFRDEMGLCPAFPVAHVVGTNGKGSTSTFLESILRAHGLRTGLFTSPHFVTPRERVLVSGAKLSRRIWTDLARSMQCSEAGQTLTYFEFQTCLAMMAFIEQGVDVAVMEAGLGGQYDATNVFGRNVTLFTPIGMDHEAVLGPTIADIAKDKAGAIPEGGIVVTGPQQHEVMEILRHRAEEQGAEFHLAADIAEVPDDVKLGLRGEHQSDNARLAIAGWKMLARLHDRETSEYAVRQGLESAFIPGRFQVVGPNGLPTIVLDGAHNSHALDALFKALRDNDMRPDAIVFSCMKDKELRGVLPLLRTLADGPIIVPGMDNERGADPYELAKEIGPRAEPVEDMAAAIERLKEVRGLALVCGSLYLLAGFYTLFPEYLNQPEN